MKYLYILLILPLLASCREDPIIYDLDAITVYFDVFPEEWVETADANIWSVVINTPEIDNIVLENGFVLVYQEVLNPSGFRQLPYTEIYNDPQDETIQYSIEKQFEFGFGELEVKHVNSLPYIDEIRPPVDREFYRVVIVTGDYSVAPPQSLQEWETMKKELNIRETEINLKP